MSDPHKSIAIVCNYQLNPDRIGGMDRFYVAYDARCKKLGYKVDWFFKDSQPHDFYETCTIYSGKGTIESVFLAHLDVSDVSYEVVVTHFLELCTPFYKKVKNSTKAYIIAVDHNPRPLEGFPLKKRLKNRIKGVLYGPYIDRFIGVSQYTCNQLRTDFGKAIASKIKLVYNGIDTSMVTKRLPSDEKAFIVASHLRHSKGIQDLIIAVSRLSPQKRDNIRIDIYGEGPYEAHLKEMVIDKGLETNITFKGSSAHLYRLYAQYVYMIQPTYMECFSLSILESLAADVPVITTTVGGNLEIIKDGENGYIFQPGDIKGLQQIIEEILDNKKGIFDNVSDKIERDFTLNHMVENHIKLLPCTSAS